MNKYTTGLGDRARGRRQGDTPQPMLIEDRLEIGPVSIPAHVKRRIREPGPGHNSRAYVAPSREDKLSISGYYDPTFRIQLATLSAREQVSQQALLGEAMNMLFDARTNRGISKTISGIFDKETVEAFTIRARKLSISRQDLLEEAIDLVLRKYGDREAPEVEQDQQEQPQAKATSDAAE